MSVRGWIELTRAASAAALATFVVVTLATPLESSVGSFFNAWVYNGLMVLACVVVGSRAYVVRRERVAWVAFTVALGSWTFGEIWYAAVQPESFPSLADVGFLGFYPLVYIGIVALVRTRARTLGGTLWVDGLTASLAAGALAAAVLVEVVLQTTEGSLTTVATNLAYPLGDVLLLSAIFGVFSLTGWRPGRRWLLLGLGVLSIALADAAYLFQTASETYVEGAWVDVFWPTGMLVIAASAWADDRSGQQIEIDGRPLLAVPASCALIAIGVLVYDHFDRVNLLALVLATAALGAVVLRLGTTFRENRRLFELTRHESITDSLTGLGNRRKLISDLQRRLQDENLDQTLLMIFDLDGFKAYNDSFGHPAGDALLTRLGTKLAAVPGERGAVYRLGGDEFCLITPVSAGEAEQLIDQACLALSESGEGFDISTSFGAIMLPDEATDASDSLRLADERLYAQKHSRRAETDRTMSALLDALSEREPTLQTHAEGVATLALETGRMLGLRRHELDDLARAARLHDIGKLAVPDEILLKPGKLDEREWEFIRQHTVVGERILRASPAFKSVGAIVRSSHERWDGTGYPDGLAGEDIPLASRIICACDAYMAMTSARTYRSPLSSEEAVAELEAAAGTQFDPTVVRVLTAHVRDRLEAEHAV
jgi:two-component system, cell cycle response regulator